MDLAKQIESKILALQNPMNDVIGRGDSAVQQFYCGATVFVTGGSGFLGKQLIEKLFRSCVINKMFVLLRPKRGKPIEERLEFMLNDPVFDAVRKKQPNFGAKLVAVAGDVTDIRLGLSEKDWNTMGKEVNIIFHLAATIRFDEAIKSAVLTNIRGTRETIALARNCVALKCFVHVSTAFTHATTSKIGTELREQFYPCPVPPDVMIGLVESTEESKLDNITPQLIDDWPNTYTFTKAIAEEMVRNTTDLPICIVKPPIVFSAYVEPSPGWADLSVVYGPIGVIIGVGLGFLHVFYANAKLKFNIAPVDIVNNAIIAAGWDAVERRKDGDEPPIYAISSRKLDITWEYLGNILRTEGRRLTSPKTFWYCYLYETDNKTLYLFLTWFMHYIPAYIIDGICYIFGIKLPEVSSINKVYKKMYKLSSIYGHFSKNDWIFKDDNLVEMISRLSDNDKKIFNCDITTVNIKDYLFVILVGIRKYILKDGLTGSLEAYKRQRIFKILNFIFSALYIYVWFVIICYCFNFVHYIVY